MLRTDEGMAEMLDVSGENLARMKEEAQLAEPETLMRYIRVFSELLGQLAMQPRSGCWWRLP